MPETATGQPAAESPKRVPDWQMDQPSFAFAAQYPMAAHYVKLSATRRQARGRFFAGAGRYLDLGEGEGFHVIKEFVSS